MYYSISEQCLFITLSSTQNVRPMSSGLCATNEIIVTRQTHVIMFRTDFHNIIIIYLGAAEWRDTDGEIP